MIAFPFPETSSRYRFVDALVELADDALAVIGELQLRVGVVHQYAEAAALAVELGLVSWGRTTVNA